jgi:hypothetical protein
VTAARAGRPSGGTALQHSKIKLKNVAYFSSRNLWCFQPHIHHDLHHVLPSKTPRYDTTISQKPLQNTTTTTPEKILHQHQKITAAGQPG